LAVGAKLSTAPSIALTPFEQLLAAIVNDDASRVHALLERSPGIVAATAPEAHLYESAIDHWFYAGDTALHLAAAGHRAQIARLLLNAGADANADGNHRRSAPLHYAADGYIIGTAWNEGQQVATIRCLVAAGAAVDARDMNGAAPLHRAVRTRCAAAVRCLIEAGCDIGAKNNSGSTAFHLAVQNTGRGGSGSDAAKAAQREIIQTFLALGLSTQSRDGKGRTVAQCATSDWIRAMLR
jgi:hypothetical protein